MNITIHRGSHEIGGTCIELESVGGSRILLDLGMPLPPLEEIVGKTHPEPAFPAVKGLFKTDMGEKPLDGLLVSHAHQDHYGLMQNLRLDVPCFMSNATRELMDITAAFTGSAVQINNFMPFHSGVAFAAGDFTVTPFLVDHSAFDSHAFLIEDGETRVFYSGDFRAHGRKSKLFEAFVARPPAPVDVLFLEGTMMARFAETCISEQEVEGKIVAAVRKEPGLVLSSVSGQNIDRLVTLVRVAMQTGRKLLIDPYIAHVLDTLSKANTALPHPSDGFSKNLGVYYPRRLCRRMRLHMGLGHVLDQFGEWRVKPDAIRRQPGRYILLVRDNMAPELEATLKVAAHGALFLYGLWKGYWDRPGMQNLHGWVRRANMQFLYAHTSGHAMTCDLQRLVRALQPKMVVPIHTTCPEEYAAHFNAPVMVAQDGVPIRIGSGALVK